MPPITIADLRGGRNGVDSPIDPQFPGNQCCEAFNVDFSTGPLGRRRGGADVVTLTGGTALSTSIAALNRWMPAGNEQLAELHVIDGGTVPLVKRWVSGVASDVTLDDPITATPHRITFAALGGKNYYAYNAGTAIDRLHVYDPQLAVPRVRRVGIYPGANAPTLGNTGSGSYVTTRYYRVRFIQLSLDGLRVIRRSEPTPAFGITPSGSGTHVVVTRPAAPGEGETHWEVDVSANNLTWYKLVAFARANQVLIATTTFNDNFAVSSYSTLEAADVLGFYTLPPSCKYLTADGNRLLMSGRNAKDENTSRVWFTPVLGSSDQGDDERLYQTATNKPFFDLNEKDGGEITGQSDAIGGVVLIYKYRRTWRAGPTLDAVTPYAPREISHVVGAIDHDGIVVAEDAEGNPAVYWMSHKGPYRYGQAGLQYLGRDVEDYWYGRRGKSAVNLDATTKVCHGKYYSQLGQIWWWVATGSSTVPNLKLVLDINQATRLDRFGVRGGWAVHDGPSALALCSTTYGDVNGTTLTRRHRPYVGLAASPTLYKCDTTAEGDAGQPYQSYVTTKSLIPAASLDQHFGVSEALLCAEAAQATIRQTILVDFSLRSAYDEVSIAPKGEESQVIRKLGGGTASELGVVQMQLGDPASVLAPQWSLHSLTVPTGEEGDR